MLTSCVGFVLDERLRPLREPGAQLLPAAAEQRPDDGAVARMHAGETARAGAARQPQQDRLRLIVAGVAERDDVGAGGDARPLEERVARRRAPRPRLDRRSRAARAAHVLAIDEKGQAERRREPGGETARRRRPTAGADG